MIYKIVSIFLLAVVSKALADDLPSIDLGYETHQAISYVPLGRFYNFSNIPYAEPPLGHLRFAKPIAPQGRRQGVNNGSVGHVCPQYLPCWLVGQQIFVTSQVKGEAFNASAAAEAVRQCQAAPIVSDPRASEDCLQLDVLAPKNVLDRNKANSKKSRGAPVLVWIFGGANIFGDSTVWGNATGLVQSSYSSNDDGVIFISMNYRVGAFGFLSGSDFIGQGGSMNTGYYDQRLALKWVQKYIHLFGGDPDRVTLIGESAGGSSIMVQMTAYGGQRGPVPFQQGIVQSPAWGTFSPDEVRNDNFQSFLKLLNVTTLAQARQLPSRQLIEANAIQIRDAPTGQTVFESDIDGDLVPEDPRKLLLHRHFDRNVKIMSANNINEGSLFSPTKVPNDAAFSGLVSAIAGHLPRSQQKTVTNTLYPSVFNGTFAYTNQHDRASLLLQDLEFTCNSHLLNMASLKPSYAYRFSAFPSVHSQDVAYTFYTPAEKPLYPFLTGIPQGRFDKRLARIIQGYFTSFAATGDPNAANEATGAPKFPEYDFRNVLSLDRGDKIGLVPDENINPRCDFWAAAPFSSMPTND